MLLVFKYAKKEDIPAGLELYYTEKDGAWVCDGVEGMKTQADVDKVLEALRKEKNDHAQVKTQLHALSVLGSPEDLQAKLDKLAELEVTTSTDKIDEKVNKLVEVRMNQKVVPLQRELDTLKANNSELSNKVQSFEVADKQRMIVDAVRSAAITMKCASTAMEDIEMFAKIHFEVDEFGNISTKADAKGVTSLVAPDVWLTEMQSKKPHWWPPSVGGGSSGSSGGSATTNPFSATGWNMTEQAKLIHSDRSKAEQLAKSAGTVIGGGKPSPSK